MSKEQAPEAVGLANKATTVSSSRKIVLADSEGRLSVFLNDIIQKDDFLSTYQLINLNNIYFGNLSIKSVKQDLQKLVGLLSSENVDILVVLDRDYQGMASLLELAHHASPHSVYIFASEDWNIKSLKEAVNRRHICRAIHLEMSKEEVLSHLHSAAIQSEMIRNQTKLMREFSRQNRELENLTENLEKIVEERTFYISISKKEIDAKVELIRQMTRFIKALSTNTSFEDLMDHVRQYIKKLPHIGDPILVLSEEPGKVELIFFRSGSYWPSAILSCNSSLSELVSNDKEMSQLFADYFGRPFIRVLTIPLRVNLIKKIGLLKGSAVLCVENSMTEAEQGHFFVQVNRILNPVSAAVDRAFLQRVFSRQSTRWERTFNGLRDPLAVIDSDYEVIHSNKKFSEGIIPKKCYEIFAKSKAPCEGCPLIEVISSGSHKTNQIKVNDRIYQVSSYPVHIGGFTKTFTSVNQYVDITQDRKLYGRMLQSEKMGAIGLLAGNIAHELNNPLTGIRNLVQVMLSEVKGNNEQLASDLLEIERAIARSQSIIKNLLDFSMGGNRIYQTVSLAEVVEKTMPLLKTTMKNHRYQVYLDARDILIPLDLQLMQQVVFNLVTNACQAMKTSGQLKIVTSLSQDGTRSELIVSDAGPGVPVDIQDKIFEPFFSTKSEGYGTGLGLSLSLDIVRKMGGDIFLKSRFAQQMTAAESNQSYQAPCDDPSGADFIVSIPIIRERKGDLVESSHY